MCISYSLYSFMIVFPNIKILVVSVVLFHHFAILIVFIFVVFMFIVFISCSVLKLLQNFTMMNMRIWVSNLNGWWSTPLRVSNICGVTLILFFYYQEHVRVRTAQTGSELKLCWNLEVIYQLSMTTQPKVRSRCKEDQKVLHSIPNSCWPGQSIHRYERE